MFPRTLPYIEWTKKNTIIKSITRILENWIKKSKDISILEQFSEDLLIHEISLVNLQKKYTQELAFIAIIFQNPKDIYKNLNILIADEIKIEIRELLNKYIKKYCKQNSFVMN